MSDSTILLHFESVKLEVQLAVHTSTTKCTNKTQFVTNTEVLHVSTPVLHLPDLEGDAVPRLARLTLPFVLYFPEDGTLVPKRVVVDIICIVKFHILWTVKHDILAQ